MKSKRSERERDILSIGNHKQQAILLSVCPSHIRSRETDDDESVEQRDNVIFHYNLLILIGGN